MKIVIGAREIAKGIKAGSIKSVMIAKNCPGFLIEKIKDVEVKKFDGDQKDLGTYLGKPFPVAMAGYQDK